jgi:hypothetical protein
VLVVKREDRHLWEKLPQKSSGHSQTKHLCFSMISVGQEIGTVYNARFEAVFGTRGFNPLARPNKRARAEAALFLT